MIQFLNEDLLLGSGAYLTEYEAELVSLLPHTAYFCL